MIGRPCDFCLKKDNPVYAKYETTSSMTMSFTINALGQIEPNGTKYQCNDCSKSGKKK